MSRKTVKISVLLKDLGLHFKCWSKWEHCFTLTQNVIEAIHNTDLAKSMTEKTWV